MNRLMLSKNNNKYILRLLLIAVTVISLQLNVSHVIAGPLSLDNDLSSHKGEIVHHQSNNVNDSAHLMSTMHCDECVGDCAGMDCNGACSPCSGAALPGSDTLNTAQYTSAYSHFFGRFTPGTHHPPQTKPPRTIVA